MTKSSVLITKPESSAGREYRRLIKRQKRIVEVIDMLTKEKFKNGVRILKLVMDHKEVKKLDRISSNPNAKAWSDY